MEVSSRDLPGNRFVAFIQNHDQVANTSQGVRCPSSFRSSSTRSPSRCSCVRLACRLLFMGEEFAETNPFLYFTSHGDPGLARLVSEGRWKEFEEFTVAGDFVDPQAPEAFERSKISWSLLHEPAHRAVLNLYCELIRLRKRWPCLNNGRKDLTQVDIDEAAQWLRVERSDPSGCRAILVCNFSEKKQPNLDPTRWSLRYQLRLSRPTRTRSSAAAHRSTWPIPSPIPAKPYLCSP